MPNRKKRPVYLVVAVALAVMVAAQAGAGLPGLPDSSATAADFISSYNSLKNNPTSHVFLQRLFAAGATEGDLESFLNDLDSEVQLRGPLNDSNFNSIMFAALQDVVTWSKHRTMFIALSDGFPAEIAYTLQNGQLHPDLVPLRNAVRDSLLGTTPNDGKSPGGGGGGGLSPDRDAVEKKILEQLERGVSRVEIEPSGSSGEIVIPGSAIKKLNQAGAELHFKFGPVNIKLPAGAFSISDQARFSLSAKTVSRSGNMKAVAALSGGQKLAGDIFEILASTESSVRGLDFDQKVTITLPYQASQVNPDEEQWLDAYWFDASKNKWVAMNGTVDRSAHTVTFSTTHFSQYAVLVHNPALSEPKQGADPTRPTFAGFADVKGHWAQDQVEKLAAAGIIAGVSPDRFEPNRNITRAEFATLLVKALEIPTSGQLRGNFQDVSAGTWYFAPVNAAANAGLVYGVTATRFDPTQPITREQLAVMVARAMSVQGKNVKAGEEQLSIFRDQKQVSQWARKGVAATVAAGIVKGRPDSTFAPLANATRAEAATMIYHLLY